MSKDPNLMTAAELAAHNMAAEGDAAAAETPPAAPAEAAPAKAGKAPAKAKATEPAKPGDRVKKGAPAVDKETLGAQVIVRITKAGDKEVHDGEGGRYDWNDEVVLPREVALALEERKHAEIVGTA